MSDKTTSPRTLSRMATTSIVVAVLGVTLVILSVGFEWSGFGGGFAIGAGATLGLGGMYYWGLSNGIRRAAKRPLWRPSADASK